jgi:hypothetical protein
MGMRGIYVQTMEESDQRYVIGLDGVLHSWTNATAGMHLHQETWWSCLMEDGICSIFSVLMETVLGPGFCRSNKSTAGNPDLVPFALVNIRSNLPS